MTKHRRLENLERRAVGLSRRLTRTARPALLESVLAKAEQVLRGEVLEPADWTNAPAATREHRDRLVEWLETKRE